MLTLGFILVFYVLLFKVPVLCMGWMFPLRLGDVADSLTPLVT